MENDVIKLEDVRKGDEILVAGGGGHLYYLKVLRNPSISKKHPVDQQGDPIFVPLKCSFRIESRKYTYTWQGNVHTYTRDRPVCTPEGHNTEKSFNLNNSTIWLIREGGTQ